VRIHVPAISVAGADEVQARLQRMRGVRRVRASRHTLNVLVEFDPARLDAQTILRRLKGGAARPARAPGDGARASSATPRSGSSRARSPRARVLETHASARRARVAVRGLDRDPEVARRLVDRLSRRPEVRRVSPSPLTGRVLIELAERATTIQELLDEIAELELPEAEGAHGIPAHPLDPAPIIEGAAKALGAGLGLLLLLTRRIAGADGAPVTGASAGEVAATIGLVEGVPPSRAGSRTRSGIRERKCCSAPPQSWR
jgi:hypothetical protein